MKKFFKYIRSQPKSVRETYAFGLAASFTAFIFVIWLVANPGLGLDKSTVAENSEKKSVPFATFIKESKEQIGAVFSSLKLGTSTTSESGEEVQAGEEADSEGAESRFNINLTPEDIEKSNEKANTPPKEPDREFTEVLIGTTTVKASSSTE